MTVYASLIRAHAANVPSKAPLLNTGCSATKGTRFYRFPIHFPKSFRKASAVQFMSFSVYSSILPRCMEDATLISLEALWYLERAATMHKSRFHIIV